MSTKLRGLFLHDTKIVITKLPNNVLSISNDNGVNEPTKKVVRMVVGDTVTVVCSDVLGTISEDYNETTVNTLRKRCKMLKDIVG